MRLKGNIEFCDWISQTWNADYLVWHVLTFARLEIIIAYPNPELPADDIWNNKFQHWTNKTQGWLTTYVKGGVGTYILKYHLKGAVGFGC